MPFGVLWADSPSPPHPEHRPMSYESRQKKRRHKRIEQKAKRGRSSETATRWYLTIAKRPGRFDCCRQTFARGDAIVFRYEPRSIRCQRCAELDPESKGFARRSGGSASSGWRSKKREQAAFATPGVIWTGGVLFATDLGHASLFATGRGPMVSGGGSRTGVPSAGGRHANESEMNDELEEPLRIVELGGTRLYITPVGFGKYLLHISDGSLIAGPFTRVDAGQFAQDLLRWASEADKQD
jgi:hypothetical protein